MIELRTSAKCRGKNDRAVCKLNGPNFKVQVAFCWFFYQPYIPPPKKRRKENQQQPLNKCSGASYMYTVTCRYSANLQTVALANSQHCDEVQKFTTDGGSSLQFSIKNIMMNKKEGHS